MADFEFPLPPELIAQVPAEGRDAARLLGLDRRSGALTHTQVHALPELLRSGDLLVVNDTRVIPARLFGRGPSGGAVELLLIRPLVNDQATDAPTTGRSAALDLRSATGSLPVEKGGQEGFEGGASEKSLSIPLFQRGKDAPSDEAVWLCLGKPSRRLRGGATLTFPDDLRATVIAADGDGRYRVAFDSAARLAAVLAQHGEIPLPPYIRRPDGPLPLDRERYQTIFAAAPGAIAAPTAGLHFTDALLAVLAAREISVARLTLHVGPGTFLPVRCEDIRAHVMDPEWYAIPAATAAAIRAAKAAGRRVVAVGTTTTRALESAGTDHTGILAGAGWAERFITPGYEFRIVDALFTNFHLPGSTLLLLVSAFAGREHILNAYAEAIQRRYRFYSYGDAMLLQ